MHKLPTTFFKRELPRSFFYTFSISFALLAAGVVAAWSGPLSAPPACTSGNPGCDAPLNVSGNAQSKTGGLLLNTGGATNGLIVQYGKVGIDTASPSQALDVAGNVTASVYYDRDNTGFYVDPNGMSNMNAMYLSYMYDRDNGGYYLDLNNTTRINSINADNVHSNGNMDMSGNLYVGALGDWLTNRLNQAVTTNSSPQFGSIYDDDRNYYLNMNTWSRINAIDLNQLNVSVIYDRDNTGYYIDLNNGSVFSYMYSRYMYDLDNPGYYLDMNSGSVFNYMYSRYMFDLDNPGYYLDMNNTTHLNALSTDSNINVGGAQLATNGDMYMPWAGQWLSTILNSKPGSGGVASYGVSNNFRCPAPSVMQGFYMGTCGQNSACVYGEIYCQY